MHLIGKLEAECAELKELAREQAEEITVLTLRCTEI